MGAECNQIVRDIVAAVCGDSVDEWTIADCGNLTVDQPPREETLDEMIAAGHVDGYRHHHPGDDRYITVGTIHLRRVGT
ncbi:MAG: hypothetical protein WCY09_09415 [Candidatus Omnitrophota bacterium]